MITTLKTEPKVQGVSYSKPPSRTESVVPATYRTRVPSGALLQAGTWASCYLIAAHKNRTKQVLMLPCFRQGERDLQGYLAPALVRTELGWSGQPGPSRAGFSQVRLSRAVGKGREESSRAKAGPPSSEPTCSPTNLFMS